VHYVDYLDKGNYLGLDREQWLIDAGKKELGPLYASKTPELVVSRDFRFNFGLTPDVGIAKSLFTHLVPDDIRLCFDNLKDFVGSDFLFFATMFNGLSKGNPKKSDSCTAFYYSKEEMAEFADGWTSDYLGDWHDNDTQQMMVFSC